MSDDAALAVVGMAGRFPGAADLDEYWAGLVAGVEAITRYPARSTGVGSYVPARGELVDPGCFDAEFFGCTPKEAVMIDPQQRLFLECAWAAVEDAGYDPARCPWPVGVYGGSTLSPYDRFVREHVEADEWALRLATSPDLLTARTAYKLGLTGPAVTVQTGCSTSLVAVHVAAQALLAGDCDAALAGGVSAVVPAAVAAYSRTGAVSDDGRIRAFDAEGSGFVSGDGVGVVLLRRLDDAVRDGDHIRAIVRGTAVNNDGATKIGFTAPSVDGQAEVIRSAQAVAGVDPATVGYVETHGTGTPLGDAVEVAALAAAFGPGPRPDPCRIGSVKTNIGHADAAAGIAGFCKTVLALEHRTLPPSLNFAQPNPAIDFTGFEVVTAARAWEPIAGTRRAGVSSLGIGGTNAHVVLEQAPERERRPGPRRPQLLTVSARTPAALAEASRRLADALRAAGPDVRLADVAFTLQQSRSAHACRRFVVADDCAAAADALDGGTDPTGPLAEIGAAWVAGAALPDRTELHGDDRPRRVPLPTYPFERRLHLPAADGTELTSPPSVPAASAVPATADLDALMPKIFAEVLGVAEVGPDDDFFELGGDSLFAIELVGRIEEEFGLELGMRDVYAASRVAQLVEVVRAELADAGGAP